MDADIIYGSYFRPLHGDLSLPFIAGNTRLLLLRLRKITLFEMSAYLGHQQWHSVQRYIFTFVAFEVAPKECQQNQKNVYGQSEHCTVKLKKVKLSLSYSLQGRNLLLHCRTKCS